MSTRFSDTQAQRKYVNHPEGTYIARCCDVWTEEKENPYKGKKQKNQRTGLEEVDTRETITKVRIKFLTESTVKIDGKEVPQSVLYFGNFSWGDNSKLRQFVAGWAPDVARKPKWEVDLDDLIGREAQVTVLKWEDGDGTSVSNASPLHKSMQGVAPMIPTSFIRHKDRENAVPQSAQPVTSDPPAKYTPPATPEAIGEEDDQLPF